MTLTSRRRSGSPNGTVVIVNSSAPRQPICPPCSPRASTMKRLAWMRTAGEPRHPGSGRRMRGRRAISPHACRPPARAGESRRGWSPPGAVGQSNPRAGARPRHPFRVIVSRTRRDAGNSAVGPRRSPSLPTTETSRSSSRTPCTGAATHRGPPYRPRVAWVDRKGRSGVESTRLLVSASSRPYAANARAPRIRTVGVRTKTSHSLRPCKW